VTPRRRAFAPCAHAVVLTAAVQERSQICAPLGAGISTARPHTATREDVGKGLGGGGGGGPSNYNRMDGRSYFATPRIL